MLSYIASVILWVVIIAFCAGIWFLPINWEQVSTLGYVGMFVGGFASGATIFLPGPAIVAAVTAGRVFSPLWVGLAFGSGTAMGEMVGYIVGRSSRNVVVSSGSVAPGWATRWLDWANTKLRGRDKRIIAVVLFLLAFVPNPFFDAAGLLAGALKLPFLLFLLPVIIGRMLRYTALASVGALL